MGTKQQIDVKEDLEPDPKQQELTCGIVMPIAAMGEYSANHWSDVYAIIKEAVGKTGYSAKLVSESDDSTVIPKSIVQNLYDDDIVICDVSGKNPNVMFELGMRLAFNKPVVLIKDDVTGYSFDTSTIEHLTYPRDLRYSSIQTFKQVLASKLSATYEASLKSDYRSFLSNFASIKIAHLEHTTVGEAEALEKIINKLDNIDSRISSIERSKPTGDPIMDLTTIGKGLKDFEYSPSRATYILHDEPFNNFNKNLLTKISHKLDEVFKGGVNARFYRTQKGVVNLMIYSNSELLPSLLELFHREVKPFIENLQ